MSTISSTDLIKAMADAWNAGNTEQVIAVAAQASDDDKANENFLLLLGAAEQATQRHPKAAETFRQLTQMRPDVSAYWNNLGVACRQAGNLDGAERALLTARSLAPNDVEVLYNLGLLYTQQQHWPLARQVLLDAVQLAPNFIEARLQAAYACYVCGDSTNQETMLSGAIDWPAHPAEQALVLAPMLSVQGDLDAALHTLAQAQLPTDEPAAAVLRLRIAAQRALLYERNNLLEAAQHELHKLPPAVLDALAPDALQARADGWRAQAALAMRTGAYANAETFYRRVLALATDDETQAGASFGLASAADRLGRYREAWQALQHAHAAQLNIARNVVPELLEADSQSLHRTNGGEQGNYADWKSLSSPSTERSPVFVVGFPRSGTTLLEQMLDAHPDFQSMDERAYIHDLIEGMQLVGQRYPEDLAGLSEEDADQLRNTYWRQVGRVLPDLGDRRLVDKNPLNMRCLPMIMRLFPHARIILCLRHPCDVLLSCSMQAFRSPAFMVLCSSLPRLAQGYAQAFEQWYRDVEVLAPHVLEWRYESVVSHFEEQVARLGQFLELGDTSPMTRFAEHARAKRFISTPSYAQVTEGVHRKAIGRWENYREQFALVLPVLQPWIDRLGYGA